MVKPDCRRSRRLCAQLFSKCFGGTKDEQLPVGGNNASEDAFKRGAIPLDPLEKSPAAEGKKTITVQSEERIKWKRAKKVFSVHRLVEGCMPRFRRETSMLSGDDRQDGENWKCRSPPKRREIIIETSRRSAAQDRNVLMRDETPSIGCFGAEDITEVKTTPALAVGHDQPRQAPVTFLPAPYEPYLESSGSSVEECSSICNFGCQYGDQCTKDLRRLAYLDTGLNNVSTSSNPKAPSANDGEGVLDAGPTAIPVVGSIHDEAEGAPIRACKRANTHAELESLTLGNPTPSPGEPSHEGSPLSFGSPTEEEADQKDFSTCNVSEAEIKPSLSRDDAITSNDAGGQTKNRKPKDHKPPVIGFKTSFSDPLGCETFESVSTLPDKGEKGGRLSFPSSDPPAGMTKDGEKEVKRALLDTNEKVPEDLFTSQLVKAEASVVKNAGIEAKSAKVNAESLSVEDPVNLSCPHIEQPPCNSPDGTPDAEAMLCLEGSLKVSNGKEENSGILHLRRLGSSNHQLLQYPPSDRGYRQQRRMMRLHRYFEEFLETDHSSDEITL